MTSIPEKRPPEELLPHEDASRVYSAVRGKRIGGMRALRILFVPRGGTHNRRLPLSDLRLQDVAKDGTEIIMEFSELTVVLKGRNLVAIEEGIGDGIWGALEAFDPALRDPPENKKAAVIDSISFHPKGQRKVEPMPARAKPRLVKDAEPA